ncbi:Transposase [Burkholderia cepacia GG4]|uniref:Transposase n=2 Tax=Burkholderia cepacia TaxID=292 RepID=A0A9W3P7V2_BURCE|nr:Transposase [Burkholderia cepacia GG4]
MLAIIDAWNRECPHIDVDFSLTGVRVAHVLEQLRQRGRCPNPTQVDNGREFVSKALDAWAHEHGVKLQFIRPGKSVEDAHIESFNGRLREECLNQHAFVSLDDARMRIEAWRTDYNSVRPHSAFRQLAPDQFRQLHQPKTGKPTKLRMMYSAEWGQHLPFGYSTTKPIYEMPHELDCLWRSIEKIASLEIANE